MKYPKGTVEKEKMLDEIQMTAFMEFPEEQDIGGYDNSDSLACAMYVLYKNKVLESETLQKKTEVLKSELDELKSGVKTIDEAFFVAKVSLMEKFFENMPYNDFDKRFNEGYASAINDLNKFLKSGE